MRFDYSVHWLRKKKFRKNITNDHIEYAIQNSDVIRDKYWSNLSNAIYKVP